MINAILVYILHSVVHFALLCISFKGPSIKDVHKILPIFDPLPLSVVVRIEPPGRKNFEFDLDLKLNIIHDLFFGKKIFLPNVQKGVGS